MHVSNLFANPVATETARWSTSVVDGTGASGQVFFCNSGAEANETALKLARKFGGRGRHVVVSALGSFHGRTLATLAATGQPAKHEPFQPMPDGFRNVAWNDIDGGSAAVDPDVAAVLIEPIQGEGGVNPAERRVPPAGRAAVRRARRAADPRRGADRVRPDRAVVRVRARRRVARRRDPGQGDRQRVPDRGVLGSYRCRCCVRAG